MPVVSSIPFGTTSAILGGLSLIPAIYAAFLTARQYRRERHLTSLLIFVWLSISVVWSLMLTLSQVIFLIPVPNQETSSVTLFLASIGLIVPLAFLAVLSADYLSKEGINSMHLFIASVVGTGTFILLFVPGQSYVQGGFLSPGELELTWVPTTLMLFNALLGIYYSYIFASLAIKVRKAAPRSIKKSARLFFMGGVVGTLVTTIVTFLGLGVYIPGSTQLSAAIGTYILAAALVREPKLFYLMPSKAIRVAVFETKGGVALFSHTWPGQENVVDDSLFAGMLQGVSLFIRESLNKGELREITVDQATLIIHRRADHPIAFVLVVTRPTKTFRLALQTFAKRFVTQFESCFNNLAKVSQFTPASTLVNECFPYVPQ